MPSGAGSSLPAVEGENLRRSVAEFVGAFALIFVGAGSVMTGGGDLLGVAVAHGLILAIMVTALGHISGGHFNPAVTLGFLVTRRIKPLLGALLLGSAVQRSRRRSASPQVDLSRTT